MYTPLSQQSQTGLTILSWHRVETCQGNVLACNSAGNALLQLSQLARPLWAYPSVKNGIGVLKLIATKKKNEKKKREDRKKKVQAKKDFFNLPPPPPPPPILRC